MPLLCDLIELPTSPLIAITGAGGKTDTLIVVADTPILLQKIRAAWQKYHRLTVAGTVLRTEKLAGLQPEQPYELLLNSGADVVIVEADGARHRMIKAPAEHEPVLPMQTNVALLMISAEAINQPLSDRIAHRPEKVATVTGINVGDVLSPAVIARLITSEQGGLKHIPETASAYLLITHASLAQNATIRELVYLMRSSSKIVGVLSS